MCQTTENYIHSLEAYKPKSNNLIWPINKRERNCIIKALENIYSLENLASIILHSVSSPI